MRINDTAGTGETQNQSRGPDSATRASMRRLSAGLSIAPQEPVETRLDADSLKVPRRGTEILERIASDAASMLVVADTGAMTIESTLKRMRELAAQSARESASDQDRSDMQKEYDALAEGVTKAAKAARYQDKALLSGGSTGYTFQVGSAASSATISYTPGSFVSLGLGNVASQSQAAQSVASVDAALAQVNDFRASVGGSMNRLEQTVQSLSTMAGNYASHQEQIRDMDTAQETTKQSRIQIQERSQQSMVGQAAQMNPGALGLLRSGASA
jgi:flagellin